MKKIHFMGIGGSGANAVAGIAHSLGYEVSGCDVKESEYVADLVAKNIAIIYGHDPSHIVGVDLLCVSPALFDSKEGEAEISYARENGVLVKTWQQFMGEDLQQGKKVIAVAGTKGKTTTTALIGHLLEYSGLDPIVAVGGEVSNWEKSYRTGEGSYFVCEADEFNNNFHWYKLEIAVVTNLEMDHPEFFASYDEYLQSFVTFISNIKPNGYLVLGTDSKGCVDLLHALGPEVKAKVNIIGFGFSQPGEEILKLLKNFNLVEQGGEPGPSLRGSHNALNAKAAEILGRLLEVDSAKISGAFADFKGVGRRFELVCQKNEISVYYDYAHIPMSVRAVLKTAREIYPESRLWAVLQPHLYSRTKMFLDEFALALGSADRVVITDIFPSREKDKPISKEIHSVDLVRKTQELNPGLEVVYKGGLQEAAQYLLEQLQPGDVVLNMGAGNNGIISDELCQKL